MSRLVEYADELVTSVGPRPGASKGEHQAAELIAQNLEDIGLDTYIQEFSCARSTGWVRILYYALGVLAAAILFFATGLKIIALVLALVGAVLLVLDLLGKNPLFNLFNKGLSQNVVARYSPDGADSRRKIIVVAHYDSGRSMIQCAPVLASSYTFLRKLIRGSLVGLLLVIALSFLPLPELLLLILGIMGVVMGVILLAAALFEIINLFMPFNQGANCNASGVATLYGIAQNLVGTRSSSLAAGQTAARQSRTARPARVAANDHSIHQPKLRGAGGAGGVAGTGRVGGTAAATGAAGAADSLFSRAKGLVSKRGNIKPDDGGRSDYPDGENGYSDDNQSGRSGVGSRSGAGDRSSAGGRNGQNGQSSQSGPHEVTANLGAAIADNLAIKEAVSSGGAVRSTINPSIRTRPPLAVQEEQDRIAREEAEEARKQAERSSGVPDWFANAKKKAAQKEASQRSTSAEDRETVRSQFADVPLSAKDIAAKAAAQSDQKPRRGDGIVSKVEKSIFAEPQLQSLRPEAGQSVEAAGADGAGASNTTGAAEALEIAKTVEAVENSATATGATAVENEAHAFGQSSETSSPSTEADVSSTASMPASAANTAPVTTTPVTSTSASATEHLSPRSAAELLQQRLSQSAPVEQPWAGAAQAAPATQEVGTQPAQAAPATQEVGSQAAQQAQPTQAAQPTQPEPASQPAPISQSSLQMDFSGLDRLASDANLEHSPHGQTQLDNPQTGQSKGLPNISSLPLPGAALEHSTATPPPAAANSRLRNIPKISLGDSGMIPTQQAAFDEQATPSQQMQQPTDSLVSTTGSFAPLGATGLMKPVGEELLSYHEDSADIYVEDSDDSVGSWAQNSASPNAVVTPHMVEIPRSRAKSFFGGIGDKFSGTSKKRNDNLDSLPSTWLGVDDDFDARNAGSEIGSWDNFSEEDDGWKGGAYGGESHDQNLEALQSFSHELIDKEVWVVALGSHENKNAGLKSFLAEHERELRNALIINIDGVGAGDLCFTISEGTFKTLSTDHRLQNLAEAAGHATGVDLTPVKFAGYTTDASAALKAGMRAISILGLDRALPLGWRWSDDRLDVIDEDNLQAVCDIVTDMVKSS